MTTDSAGTRESQSASGPVEVATAEPGTVTPDRPAPRAAGRREDGRDQTSALIAELHRLVRSVNEPKAAPPSRFDWMSSKLFVTVVGGVILSTLTLTWQQIANDHRFERDRAIEAAAARYEQAVHVLKRKEDAYRRFADEFRGAHSRLHRMVKRFLWLRANKDERPDHPAGATFGEAYDEYKVLQDQYDAGTSFEGLLLDVRVAFQSPQVTDLGARMFAAMTAIMNEETDESRMLVQHAIVNRCYDEILSAMVTEIEQTQHQLEGYEP
jgi:hypothetical protein